jgi:hypothetical protein
MKLKSTPIMMAASLLLCAGLAFAPDMAAAGSNGGGNGGGFGHGGGGRPSFAGPRMQMHNGGVHNFNGGMRFNKSFASHPRNLHFNKSYQHNFKSYKHNVPGKSLQGKPKFVSKPFKEHHPKKPAWNPQALKAKAAAPNAFFKQKYGGKFDGHHHHHHHRWYGPVFWPYYWGDYYSYAFWPNDYYDVYWGYGPDTLVWGAFWPQGESIYDDNVQDDDYAGDIYRPYRRRGANAAPAKANAAVVDQTCSGFAPGVSDLPIQQLEKVVDATEEQRSTLNDLKAATARASDILKQSCATETPLTPVSRLDAMQKRLQAMEEANATIKEPLAHLFSLLTDRQKNRLAAISDQGKRRRAPAKAINVVQLCTSQAGFANAPVEQISSAIELTDAQKAELDKLRTASAEASEGLKASCPTAVPDAVDARLDAAQQRVTALIHAVDTVRPAVRDFYASLTDEQKAALSVQSGQPRNRG